MHFRPAEARLAEIARELLAEKALEQIFDAQKRDGHVGQADQQYRPEESANQENIEAIDLLGFGAQRDRRIATDPLPRDHDTQYVKRKLQSAEQAYFAAEDTCRPRPLESEGEHGVDEVDQQRCKHGPAERTCEMG